MSDLVKISEISLKYDISTRALRYYEDVGLIKSVRTHDYAYRLYDNQAIKRLEQILVLRKLNISIKDIQKIFACNEVDVLLDVLSHKVNEIDAEVSLLHQLKTIVLTFIRQVEKSNITIETNLQTLYDQANSLNERTAENHNLSSSSVANLVEVTEKLGRMPDIRIVKLPRVKMARSGNADLEVFDQWWSSIEVNQTLFPRDFMWFNSKLSCFEWLFAIPEHLTDTNGYDVFDFPGGLYAVATALDEGEEIGRISRLIHKWVDESSEFELSDGINSADERYDMGHVVSPPECRVRQMDLFIPITKKEV